MSSILESVGDLLSRGQTMDRFASQLGASRGETGRIVDAAAPALMSAMIDRCDAPGGLSSINAMLDEDDGTVIADAASFLASDKPALGNGMLDTIAGAERRELVDRIVGSASTSGKVVRRALPMLAPIVVGVVAERKAADGMNAQAMRRFLASERSAQRSGHAEGSNLAPGKGAEMVTAQPAGFNWMAWALGSAVAVFFVAWVLSLVSGVLAETAAIDPAAEAPVQALAEA